MNIIKIIKTYQSLPNKVIIHKIKKNLIGVFFENLKLKKNAHSKNVFRIANKNNIIRKVFYSKPNNLIKNFNLV